MSELGDGESLGDAAAGSAPMCGDASLQLFGHGWTPNDSTHDADSYQGRHRAPDA
ncbi:MAG: hypothetical protein ABW137_04985 [Mycobacterium sp.]